MSWRVRAQAHLGTFTLDVDLDGVAGPLALIGPNGSGKTTLLRLLAGAIVPSQGDVEIGGKTAFSSERRLDVPCEQRRVGYVPQGYGLFPHLRVIDNVAFGLSTGPERLPRAARRDAALAMLRSLDCAHLASRLPRELSGGEQQRVALARVLVKDPDLLLLDEPLAALDATARRTVRAFLADRLKTLGCPSLVVTHDARDVAALGATVCVLESGRVVQRGTLEELGRAPATDFVAEFLGVMT